MIAAAGVDRVFGGCSLHGEYELPLGSIDHGDIERECPRCGEDRRDALVLDAELIVNGIVSVLSEYSAERLREIAALRAEIRPEGWMQQVIREYLEVWR